MTMEQNDHKKNSKSIGIQFDMDAETNRLLEKYSSESVRTKKSEAKLRLADHVRRFSSITKVGVCKE